MNTEKQVIEYIAKELSVAPSELVFSDEVCPTCFNLLKESYFGGFLLISMTPREKAEKSRHWHKRRRYIHNIGTNDEIPVLCGIESYSTRVECATFTTSTSKSRTSRHLWFATTPWWMFHPFSLLTCSTLLRVMSYPWKWSATCGLFVTFFAVKVKRSFNPWFPAQSLLLSFLSHVVWILWERSVCVSALFTWFLFDDGIDG